MVDTRSGRSTSSSVPPPRGPAGTADGTDGTDAREFVAGELESVEVVDVRLAEPVDLAAANREVEQALRSSREDEVDEERARPALSKEKKGTVEGTLEKMNGAIEALTELVRQKLIGPTDGLEQSPRTVPLGIRERLPGRETDLRGTPGKREYFNCTAEHRKKFCGSARTGEQEGTGHELYYESPSPNPSQTASWHTDSRVQNPSPLKGTVPQRAEHLATKDYDVYPAHVAFKIYEKRLEKSRCKKIGDGSFFIAKRTWERLLRDFPIAEKTKLRLLPNAFEADSERVFDEVSSANLNATCAELSDLLERRLCNDTHQSALRDKFFGMKWNEKRESFDRFASCLRSAFLSLPTGTVDEGVLVNRLRSGLPQRIQDQAILITGGFDEVVSKLSNLSSTQLLRGESVREVKELSSADQEQSTAKERQRSSALPGDANKWASVKCHYCGELGHISRTCEKNMADKKAQGNARAGQQSPAAPNHEK